ncbi:MAG: bile acid:sodium symporter family protein [Microscillaceae bacterium]|nr:bile acid:sodium symporter family protein [Microscillaceae bacterium]
MEDPIFSVYILPIVLSLVMLGLGLSLTMQDFKNIFIQPIGLITGLCCQMIVLPTIALVLAQVSGLSPELQVGIVLVAACPGGAISNLINYMLGANLALSVSMTAVNSFLVIFTIPTIMEVTLWYFLGDQGERSIHLPFWSTILQILLITVIPCLVGIYIRYLNKILAYMLERPLHIIMPFLLAFAMLGAIFFDKKEAFSFDFGEYSGVAVFTFLLNILGMLSGYWLAYGFRLGKDNQITIAIEVGMQNTALAITIATSPLFLNNFEMAIPASIYALFTFFTAVAFGLIVKPELLRFNRPPV